MAIGFQTFGQHLGLTFQKAEKQGIVFRHLDSIYMSAIHVDSSLAVFKTEKEQEAMGQAWIKLLQDFGEFLRENNFKWDKPIKCMNKIYFNSDGTINYFFYNLSLKSVEQKDILSAEQQKEFDRLLNLFIQDYKISLAAETKFSQCGPSTFKPNP